MKEFWVYTGLRVALFAAALLLVGGVWMMVADQVPVLWVVVIAFVLSGVGSYFVLNRQRDAFARRVDARAARMAARFEEMRTKEDAD